MLSQLKDFSTPKQLSLGDKTEINSTFLALRFKYSISFLSEKKLSKSVSFKAFIKAMILGYGSTHSAKGSGFFIDPYSRLVTEDIYLTDVRGIDKQRKSQLSSITIEKKDEHEVSLLIENPITVKKILAEYPIRFKKLSIKGLKYDSLYVSKEDAKPIIKKLATAGQFIDKTMQLWIMSNKGKFKEIFSKLFAEANPKVPIEKFNQYINDLVFNMSEESIKTIQTEILLDIKNAYATFKLDQPRQVFYLQFFMRLISNIDLDNISTKYLKEMQLSFARLQLILIAVLKDIQHYERFMFVLEYAFDEITYLVTLSNQYSKKMVKDIFINFIQNNYQIDLSNGVKPNIFLGHSGMQVLTDLIYTTMDEIGERDDIHSSKLYLQKDVHFELKDVIDYRVKSEKTNFRENEILYIYGKDKTIVEPYQKNKICDILVCAFNENISFKTQYGSLDIADLIENQLQVRIKNKCEQKKLIIIMDTTLNCFDDSKIDFLMMLYEEKIKNGQLAILTVHSLNKYFHMGFDKLPAGLSVGFYNKEHFPLIEKFYKTKYLRHFKYDPVPKMLAHMIQYTMDNIISYHNLVLGNSRFAHSIIPKELMNINKVISIYNPYTADIFKDVSGFLILKFNFTKEMGEIEELSEMILSDILSIFNIKRREGYGFNRTYFTPVGNLYRLSIGTEPTEDLKKMLSPLFQLCLEINNITELCVERMGLDYTYKFIYSAIYQFAKGKRPHEEANKNQINNLDDFKSSMTSAKNNNPDAQYKIGLYYEKGIEIKKDLKEAFSWFRIASYHNHPEAIYKVAVFFEKGFGVEKNINIAIDFYKKAATMGNEKAQYRLGLYYQENQDIVMAGIYYVKASLQNHPNAFFRLGQQTTQEGIETNYHPARFQNK
jgi:hypothetical protein